jgi:hypothetical protein
VIISKIKIIIIITKIAVVSQNLQFLENIYKIITSVPGKQHHEDADVDHEANDEGGEGDRGQNGSLCGPWQRLLLHESELKRFDVGLWNGKTKHHCMQCRYVHTIFLQDCIST